MMNVTKVVLATTLAFSMFATPVMAWDKAPTPTPSQTAYNKAVSKAQASMTAKMQSSANAASAASGGGGGSATGGSVGDTNAWGFSYVRNPITIPQAVATPDVVVTSMGVELGPLFSYSNQSLQYTPGGLDGLANALNRASTYDGTDAGKAVAMDYAAVLCAKEPEVAKLRFGDKCNDLASLFPVSK